MVSRDLKTARFATHITGTLQRVLGDWTFHTPQLQDLYDQFNAGCIHHPFALDIANYMAPLPRAYQQAGGSAYLNHVELTHEACGAEMPPKFWTDPLMYQGDSDDLAGAHDPTIYHSKAFDIDFKAEVAIITGDVSMGTEAAVAAGGIHLIVLTNGMLLHNLVPAELGKGLGFFRSESITLSSPVTVALGELGDVWRERKVHLPMMVCWNNKKIDQPEYGTDMMFDFGQLIAHIRKTHNVCTGSIIGSGTISNVDRNKGYVYIAEKRMLEIIESGAPITKYMHYGDTMRIEVFDTNGVPTFGVIDQEAVAPGTQA